MELLQQGSQKQLQKISQRQIQAINMLSMGIDDLREEIYKAASENPALEIVKDPLASSPQDLKKKLEDVKGLNSSSFKPLLENQAEESETLQQHLMKQLRLCKISTDEFEICQKLIYNLDKNGCYGSMLAPQSLLNKTRPIQNQKMLQKCMELIQNMDPVGTCCKNLEESLFVQAKIAKNAPPLALFILDNHLDLLSPPQADKVLKNINTYKAEWHSKKFATALSIDSIKLDLNSVQEAIDYILKLNPRPAENYRSDSSKNGISNPDVVLTVTKVKGYIAIDDFENGKITGTKDYYFQVKYASGLLPEIRISDELKFDKESVQKAKQFIDNLQFRESTIALQGCAIVANQRDFFIKGHDYLKPLLRRQLAQQLGIHESTVSRLSSRKGSKFIQTDWGILPFSYFFSNSIKSGEGEEKISSQVIKSKIVELTMENENLSDSALTRLLNDQGIKIARRTVTKYRQQAGVKNSYLR